MVTTLIIIASLIALLFIISLLMGKEMRVENTITINKTQKDVFEYLKLTKNQDYFSTWNMADPTMKKDYKGTDGTVGFIYKWESLTNKNVGSGEQETKKIEEGKSIEYELRFFKPMKNVANSKFEISPLGNNETSVKWVFYGPTKFPMTLLKSVFQNMLGKDMQKGLANLKTVLEK